MKQIFRMVLGLRFVNYLCIVFLKVYWRYFDETKGFKCAYGVVNRSRSCSNIMHRILIRYPLLIAAKLCHQQLVRCDKAASMTSECTHVKMVAGRAYVNVAGAMVMVASCTNDDEDPTNLPSFPS